MGRGADDHPRGITAVILGMSNIEPTRPLNQWTWFFHLNGYHWFVLIVAALGWLFDTMDQQIFAVSRKPAMRALLSERYIDEQGRAVERPPSEAEVNFYATISTSIFMVGWALGGLIFGVLGDRVGRARVMLWTILIYSLCTGLSAFSRGFWDFCAYRFVTGLGVGGEFAVGVALVAEVIPGHVRTYALGLLQASSTIGNSLAAVLSMYLGHLESLGEFQNWQLWGFQMTTWRLLFVIGALPALLAIVIRWNLKEPETWVAARQRALAGDISQGRMGSYAELFGDCRWRRHAIVGLVLGTSGIVGLWGIGFFIFDLFSGVIRKHLISVATPPSEIDGRVAFWVGLASLLMNGGGFLGMYFSSFFANWVGRRMAFAVAFSAALISTVMTFAFLQRIADLFWMVPLMGFCQLSIFGLYAVYFPELFPTRLRSTGTSFCYNVGRVFAAVGPLVLGLLTRYVFTEARGFQEGFRWAAVTMCVVFLVGLAALPFAPETKGQPLPD